MFLHFDLQSLLLFLLLYANFTVEHFLPISCQFHVAPFVVVIVVVVVVVVVANLSSIARSISILMCVQFVVVVVHVKSGEKTETKDM